MSDEEYKDRGDEDDILADEDDETGVFERSPGADEASLGLSSPPDNDDVIGLEDDDTRRFTPLNDWEDPRTDGEEPPTTAAEAAGNVHSDAETRIAPAPPRPRNLADADDTRVGPPPDGAEGVVELSADDVEMLSEDDLDDAGKRSFLQGGDEHTQTDFRDDLAKVLPSGSLPPPAAALQETRIGDDGPQSDEGKGGDADVDPLEDAETQKVPDRIKRALRGEPLVLGSPADEAGETDKHAIGSRLRGKKPWYHWPSWRKRNKVLSIIGGVLLALLVTTWLLLPTIVESIIRSQLGDIEKELGRDIEFEDVDLHGLTGITLNEVRIVDRESGESFAELDSVTVKLNKNPLFYSDFKVASIDVVAPAIKLVRDEDGNTNYGDLQEKFEKLFKEKEKKDKKKKKPKPWKKYITPLPTVTVTDGSVTIDDAWAGPTGISSLKDINVTVGQAEKKGPIDISVSTKISWYMALYGTGTQQIHVDGYVRNKNDGELKLTFGGQGLDVPVVDQMFGRGVRIGSVTFTMPTTFVVTDLLVAGEKGYSQPMLSAEKLRAEFVQLPPKRVAGVYLHETEVDGLFVDLIMDEDGVFQAEKLIREMMPEPPSELEKRARRIARYVQNGARKAVGKKTKKPKGFNPKDYFYSQRLYINEANVRVEDRRPDGTGITRFNDVDLAFGYRPIQRRIEVELGLDVDEGEGGKVWLGGGYGLKTRDVRARLQTDSLSLKPVHRMLEGKLKKNWEKQRAEDGEDAVVEPDLLTDLATYLLGNALELGEASLRSDLTVKMDARSGDIDLDGMVGMSGVRVDDRNISALPVEILDMETELKARYRHAGASLNLEKARISLGEALFDLTVKLDGLRLPIPGVKVDSKKDEESDRDKGQDGEDAGENEGGEAPRRFSVSFSIPEQPAQNVLDGIPYGLKPNLEGMKVDGNVAFQASLEGSPDGAIEDWRLDSSVTISEDFAVTAWPKGANVMGLNTGMTMQVKDPNALMEHEISIPPSTHQIGSVEKDTATYVPSVTVDEIRANYPHWVVFEDLSPWLVQIITTTEDGSFFRHDGFSEMQILSSLQRNVNKGGFMRGASTASMQLVKNVFLGRQKTLARKFQEVLITWLMESVVDVPKKRILEVYFNVVEFGPEIYGIADGARHYFGKKPIDLTLREAAFLISVLPRPRSSNNHWIRGAVSEGRSERLNWVIDEMYRRKCDPDKLRKIRERYERKGKPVPFKYCCPPPQEIAAQKAAPIDFYKADLEDPQYRPDLYTENGGRRVPREPLNCGFSGDPADLLPNLFDEPPLPPPPVPMVD